MSSTPPKPALNEGQQKAADRFFEFLFSDDVEFDIRGPGGVGKTFLMGALIDNVIPRYHEQCALMGIPPLYNEVVMTATTNKAAEALEEAVGRPTSTIHSCLALIIKNDFKTGETKLTRRRDWAKKENLIVFIDECSMIDSALYYQIHATLDENCKIVYVGDHKQCPPIMERVSPIYSHGIKHVELTENVRAAGQPALLALCDQFRHTVATQDFQPIQTVPGIIDYMDDEQMAVELASRFSQTNTVDRILCYTNSRVREFNNYIRDLRGLPDHITKGEALVNAASYVAKDFTLSVEKEVVVCNVSPEPLVYIMDGKKAPEEILMRRISLAHPQYPKNPFAHDLMVPENPADFHAKIKQAAADKKWDIYFHLKEKFLDLRARDASTVYKAQGSTYDTVIVDLGDIGECHNAQQVAHMLYVAVSRPKSRIILFGELPAKYGSVV